MAWAAPSTCWAWLLSGGCLLCRRTGFLGGYLLQEKNGSPGLALAHSKCPGRSRAPTSGVDSVVCGGVVKSWRCGGVVRVWVEVGRKGRVASGVGWQRGEG